MNLIGTHASFGSRRPVVISTTWNPSDKGANCTLTNGDLTASLNTIAQNDGCRSILGVSSGKWYFEFTIAGAAGTEMVGVSGTVWDRTALLGKTSDSYSYYGNNGQKRNNNAGSSYGDTFGNGDIISVLLDMDAGTLTFWKNGVSQGQAFSGIGATMYAAFGGGSGSAAESVTANFGAAPFVYTPPAGYHHGLGRLA